MDVEQQTYAIVAVVHNDII